MRLNNLSEWYPLFDYIERIIERRETFTMKAFIESVDKFLDFNEYHILTNKGNISMTQHQKKAVSEYKVFNTHQKVFLILISL